MCICAHAHMYMHTHTYTHTHLLYRFCFSEDGHIAYILFCLGLPSDTDTMLRSLEFRTKEMAHVVRIMM